MGNTYQIYLISDSTGETLDRIFLSLKSQFANFAYEKKRAEIIDFSNPYVNIDANFLVNPKHKIQHRQPTVCAMLGFTKLQ